MYIAAGLELVNNVVTHNVFVNVTQRPALAKG